MRRYYICDLIETETADGVEINPAVADLGVNYSAVFPPQNTDGSYTKNHCFVVVEAPNHKAILADPRCEALPDFPLDVKMNAMSEVARARLNGTLSRRDLSIDWYDSDKSFRDVVRSFGKSYDPDFSEDKFDVSVG